MKNIIATFLANLNDWEDWALKHMDLQAAGKLSLLLTVCKDWGNPTSGSLLLLSGPKDRGRQKLGFKAT